jgi:tetratricopeptide (TPR) repeat protein
MMEQYRQQGRGAAGAAGAAEPSGAEPPGAGGRPGHHHEVDSREEYERMKNESNTDYLWRKSDQAFHDGDYERAVALHRAIVVLDPADFESYSVAAWLLWSMGRGDDAMQFLGQGLKANPNEWEMWDAAGQHYDVVKRAREAKEAFARAVQLIPKEQNSQMLRRRFAHAAEKSGDVQTSLETWRALTRDFPGQQVNQNNLARLERVAAGQEKPRTVNEQ